jgi:uncharacterized GH25 family protein
MRIFLATVFCLFSSVLCAHDTWVQPNSTLIRTSDAAYVDLMLGNHGNGHRDFKLASKIDLTKCTLTVLEPTGATQDLKPLTCDMGHGMRDGFWQARFVTKQPGLHRVVHTVDTLHLTTRALKSAKTFFLVADKLDEPVPPQPKIDAALGHPLEFIVESDVLTNLQPGQPLKVQLLLHGKPLADTVVSFIPRGGQLAEGFDSKYERKTDAEGRSSYTPDAGGYLLVVAHHRDADAKGEGFDQTSYTATVTVIVPEKTGSK